MDDQTRYALRLALLGFLSAAAASLVVGVVGFGDPVREAGVTAALTGVGVAIAFFAVYRARTDAP